MKKYIFWENNPLKKEIEYQIFNSKYHDTDTKWYWVSALCGNCNESTQVAIPQKQKVDQHKIADLVCPKCIVSNCLRFAKWNGKTYEVIPL